MPKRPDADISARTPRCRHRHAVIGTADKVIPPALLQSMAQRAGAHITDVNAGHLSLISRAGTVTRVILQAASATS